MSFLFPAVGRNGRRLRHEIATRVLSVFALVVPVFLSFSSQAADSVGKPNVLFILADDMC